MNEGFLHFENHTPIEVVILTLVAVDFQHALLFSTEIGFISVSFLAPPSISVFEKYVYECVKEHLKSVV